MSIITLKPIERPTLRDWTPQQVLEDEALIRQGKLSPRDFFAARTIKCDKRGKLMNPVKVELRDRHGLLKKIRYTHNLRTNDGADWQARAMGGGPVSTTLAAFGFSQTAAANIAITAPTGSTVGKLVDTNTFVASTYALNQFIGCTLVYGDNTTPRIAHIVGNKLTATNSQTWYFDNWMLPDSPQSSSSAPAANKPYFIVPGSPAFYVGLATNSGAQAATDHLIGNVTSGASAEIGSGLGSAPAAAGLGRAYAAAANSWSHTASGTSYILKNVFTASGSFTAVQQCGMFTGLTLPGDTEGGDLTNAGQGGGVMVFENTFSSVNMISGDTLTVTWTVNY